MKHRLSLSHEIDNNPEPDDVGITTVTARIFDQDDNSTFPTVSLAKDFIFHENDTVDAPKKTEDFIFFLMDDGINDDDIKDALLKIIVYFDGVAFRAGCAFYFRLDFVPDYLDDDDDGDDSRDQEAVQASFDDTSSIRFRPASKLAVKSLTRKIYNKKIKKEKKKKKKRKKMISFEECMICLEEFSNGGTVVTLSCGHEFDDECIVKWFETSHVCPLCRFELPCQDEL